MKLIIPKDVFSGNPTPPRLFLCTQGGKRIGELQGYEVKLNAKWNSYSELTFLIDRNYTDIITGEAKVNQLFDKAETLRQVLVENIGYFIIQDQDDSFSDKDSKTITAFSVEYATSQKYLENWHINTGEEDSVEVIYETKKYGENRTVDSLYVAASGPYDAHRRYYIQEYDAKTLAYKYIQTQISTEEEYLSHFEDGINADDPLYISNYENVQFYDPQNPELSLLHLVFKKIPEWKIKHVDTVLKQKERKFSEERISIYDFLTNNVCDTFKCSILWNTLTKEVSFYEEAEDGINEDGTIQSIYSTDVYISRENLANEVNVKVSSDNIKTKLKVSGSDDLDIREVNLGKNYIMNLDYYHNLDWMEQDLYEKYQDYLDTIKLYSPQYTDAVQGWVKAYNSWNELMNAVPVDGNIVRIGDEFKKLYCIYIPQYEEDATDDEIKAAIDTAETALIKKLGLYHANEDLKANKSDNVLLKLKHSNSNTATIRIYNNGTEAKPEYKIQVVIVNASTGMDSIITRDIRPWITGELTTDGITVNNLSELNGYTISAIGTMGAYLVLTKDETQPENLQDYGVRLLQEKRDTYTMIFQTQTEAMFSQEKYQCYVGDEPPTGTINEGTRWFDTNETDSKKMLKKYDGTKWVSTDVEVSEEDRANYENYQRYIDNYNKLQAVQQVLLQKEKEAEYWLNGYAVSSIRINADEIRETKVEAAFDQAARTHFEGSSITRVSFDPNLPLWEFTTSAYPDKQFVVYLRNSIPYIAYKESRGVYQAKMDRYSQLTDFEAFFYEDQWIRLSPLIREDEYNDSNFLLTGYESETERLEVCNELMEYASKELKTLAQPSLEFSMNMANILALPEFEPIKNQFALGNFIRIELRPGNVKRARLLEVQLNFDNLSDFSCAFGNLVTTYDQVDLHAELLKQAVTAGKTVAASSSDWQKAADKTNKIEENIKNGLQDVTLEIGKASGQSIEIGQYGIRGRKLIDGTTDQFEDEQVALINNKLCFTSDGWKTSKSAFGKFEIEDENGNKVEHWGMLAEAMVGGYIEGAVLRGGSLKIGKKGGSQFIVNEDGSVQITDASGGDKYASQSTVETLENARRYRIELSYDKSTLFSDINSDCTITCTVYSWQDDVTQKLLDNNVTFAWKRISNSDDSTWNNNHQWNTIHDGLQPNQIKITNNDVPKNAQIECQIIFDDTILNKEGE